ncbi:unnamed protein product [Scytosiphon promiscuus]
MKPSSPRLGSRAIPLLALRVTSLACGTPSTATAFIQPLVGHIRAAGSSARGLPTNDGTFATCSPLLAGMGVRRAGDGRDITSGPRRVAMEQALDPASTEKEAVTASGVRVAKSGLSPDSRWITDPWDRGVLFSVKVDQILHDVRSKFQRVQVLETPAMGRMLVLDSALQCAERDEAGYHEYITHVALCRKGAAAGSGKRACIIGGGDGGAAREILRHDDFGAVDLVDIDAEVMAASKKFIPNIWRHPTSSGDRYVPLDSDSRLTVRAEDGVAFLSDDSQEGYDLIVVDASDPIGPGAALYSDNFYALLRRRLKPKGAVAVQGGSFWYLPLVFRTVFHGLKKAFPEVRALQCFTAVYPGGLWNVQVATLGDDPQEVNLEKALDLCSRNELAFYSPEGHHAAFALPPVALRELAKPRPSLSDTSADLESIMAFGEENEDRSDGSWEPDVRRSLSRLLSGTATENSPLAAFDADGTLWDGDAAEVFMDWMKASNRWTHHGDFVDRYYFLLAKGRKNEAYGLAAQLFDGMELPDISALCEESFQENMRSLVVPEMKQLIQDLRSQGWRVVIVTASPAWIVEPGARLLGLGPDDILGIEVEVSGGKATSTLRHPLPVREGKVEVLKKAFKDTVPTLAVGNSLDDSAMLDYARGLALVSNPNSAEISSLARKNGWSIHHI